MNREEIKLAITKLLEDTPEQVLTEILNYLEAVRKVSPEMLNKSQNLIRILREDKELLARLGK